MESWQENLDHLLDLAQHSGALLQGMQEQALAARMRPAALLLKPLVPWVEEAARRHGTAVACTVEGLDLALDQALLDCLKIPVRRLLDYCVAQPRSREALTIPLRGGFQVDQECLHVYLEKFNDHIRVNITDDNALSGVDNVLEDASLAQVQTDLKKWGGDLKLAATGKSGRYFVVTLPLSMAVLDGMVVRVARAYYVVPLEAVHRIVNPLSEHLLTIAAENGMNLLQLGDELIPIRRLSGDATLMTGANVSNPMGAVDALQASGNATTVSRQLFVVVEDFLWRKIALRMDDLGRVQQVLIRPLQGYLTGIRGVSGCALLSNGDVGFVLDMNGL